MQISKGCVDSYLRKRNNSIQYDFGKFKQNLYLVFPFKVLPHLSEFMVCAAGWNNVIHNVDMDSVQDHHICCERCIVNLGFYNCYFVWKL